MLAALKRVFGFSKEQKAAEDRYNEQLEKLEKRQEELEELGEQLKAMSLSHIERREELSKASVDLTDTLIRSLTPPDMKAVTEDEREEPPGEKVPVG
jgi:hypothetical protein